MWEVYVSDKMEIIHVILSEMGCEMNEVVDRKEGMDGVAGTLWGDECTDEYRVERILG